jgi:hypothetical protein
MLLKMPLLPTRPTTLKVAVATVAPFNAQSIENTDMMP